MHDTDLSYIDIRGIISRFDEVLSDFRGSSRGRGRPAGVSLGTLLFSTIRQKIFNRGGMTEHVEKTCSKNLEGSTISRRLAKIPKNQLEAVSESLLGPIGERSTNPQGYYHDYRMVGIDGTCFTLINTDAILEKVPKSKSRNRMGEEPGEVAFPQIYASSLVELGPHNPVALSVGVEGESEMELSMGLISKLTGSDMLFADRRYGVAWFLHQLLEQSFCRAFLLKLSAVQTSREIEQLEDGSWIVEVDVRSRRRPGDIIATHRVREIRFEVTSIDGQGQPRTDPYRLWTNFMDCRRDPALQLVELYRERWEHEAYYRELKLELKKQKYLKAQLIETAHIEILSMVWASSLIARERLRLSTMNQPQEKSRRIRFDVVAEQMRVIWPLQTQVGKHLSHDQFKAIVQSLSEDSSLYYTPKRRTRSCPRKVRKTQTHWPKLRQRTESKQPPNITITQ
ncbi:MAG: hypothetical protein AAGJ81_02415 [Verrucomicrobiota bacterium]